MQTADTARVKLSNKIVSQFEAGEVQDPFGGHLADYVYSTGKHLRKTLAQPGVQKEVVLEWKCLTLAEGGEFSQKQRKNWYKTPWWTCLQREKVCLLYSLRKVNCRTLRRY